MLDLADNDGIEVLGTDLGEGEEVDGSEVVAVTQVWVPLGKKGPEPLIDVFCQKRGKRRLEKRRSDFHPPSPKEKHV